MRITPDLVAQSPQFTNPLNDREIKLRAYKIPAIENLGATQDQFDTIDLSDNEIRKLEVSWHLPAFLFLLPPGSAEPCCPPYCGLSSVVSDCDCWAYHHRGEYCNAFQCRPSHSLLSPAEFSAAEATQDAPGVKQPDIPNRR
jgi:hypothetical protein